MKALASHDKMVTLEEGEKEEHSSAQGHERTRKEEETKGNKGKSMDLVKSEGPSVLVPFVQAIMDVHISEQFVPPEFKMYDGTTNPEAHVKSFTNAMAFRTSCDAIWCWAFSLSLKGEVLEWFNLLPNNSIENFKGLGTMFKK